MTAAAYPLRVVLLLAAAALADMPITCARGSNTQNGLECPDGKHYCPLDTM